MDLVGWKCPKCQRILSPFVPSCPYCLPKEAVITNRIIAKGTNGSKFKGEKLKVDPVEEPKVQLTNEIFAEWMNGPAEGGGK